MFHDTVQSKEPQTLLFKTNKKLPNQQQNRAKKKEATKTDYSKKIINKPVLKY